MAERLKTSVKTPRPTVMVGCKLPNGLILRIFDMVPHVERGTNGVSTTTNIARLHCPPIVIKGNRVDPDADPETLPLIRSNYALTEVDADFMDRWMHDNEDSDIVKNNLVFIASDQREAEAIAKDHKSVRSGMEPLKQDGDPRMPKKVQRGEVPAEAVN